MYVVNNYGCSAEFERKLEFQLNCHSNRGLNKDGKKRRSAVHVFFLLRYYRVTRHLSENIVIFYVFSPFWAHILADPLRK